MLAFAPDVAMLELQPNPEPLVHWSACAAPLQPVTVIAVGLAVAAVALPRTVLAACVASWVGDTPPAGMEIVTFPVAPLSAIPEPAITESTIDVHPGAVDDPVETTACPLVDPVGFRSWTGARVVEKALAEISRAASIENSFFMDCPYPLEATTVLPVIVLPSDPQLLPTKTLFTATPSSVTAPAKMLPVTTCEPWLMTTARPK